REPRRGRPPAGRHRQRPLHHGPAPLAGAAPAAGPRPHRIRGYRAMNSLLPFIVVGLATGAVYGLAGVGLVLTYRTSGVFNFAHGAVASAGAYLFYELHNKHGLAWPLAVAVCVLLLGPAMGVVLELIGRRLAGQSAALRVVATVGLLLVQAVGAAAVGRFRNVGMTFVGGLAVGVAAAVSQRYATNFPSLLGFPPSVPFFVLFAILIASKKGSLFEVGEVRRQATGHL